MLGTVAAGTVLVATMGSANAAVTHHSTSSSHRVGGYEAPGPASADLTTSPGHPVQLSPARTVLAGSVTQIPLGLPAGTTAVLTGNTVTVIDPSGELTSSIALPTARQYGQQVPLQYGLTNGVVSITVPGGSGRVTITPMWWSPWHMAKCPGAILMIAGALSAFMVYTDGLGGVYFAARLIMAAGLFWQKVSFMTSVIGIPFGGAISIANAC